MVTKPGRPPVLILFSAIIALVIGIARAAKPHTWYDPAGFLIVASAWLFTFYVTRALAWLKGDRRQ
jgi:hypothetical protein